MRGKFHTIPTLAVAVLLLVACGGTIEPSDDSYPLGAATSAAATPKALDSPPSSTSSTAEADKTPMPQTEPTVRPGSEVRAAWASYPWAADDGLACPLPIDSPGVSKDPSGPGLVVVVGDSLIRESRHSIEASLAEAGFDVVFVCWGGKNLLWGGQQITHLRELNLMPACLVVNLGTNDLKGTTAQGLADAVPLETVAKRLQEVLLEVMDVADVFVVDIAADLALAPATMAEVGDAPQVWTDAVERTGVGAAVPWSALADQGGLIGGDGIHDSEEGQWARAQLITEYVVRDCV